MEDLLSMLLLTVINSRDSWKSDWQFSACRIAHRQGQKLRIELGLVSLQLAAHSTF
jgi:hypothetical protein